VNARAALATALGAIALLGATSAQLDSQYVLQRYALQIQEVATPKDVVAGYAISQAGLGNIEARHILYRSGLNVRDETLEVDGNPLRQKRVRFEQREDRYAVARVAPRADAYQLLFLHAVKDGGHLDYVYDATPLVHQGGFSVDQVTIDGAHFLPRMVRFHTDAGDARGSGAIEYAAFGKYWMPVTARIDATVAGKPARERITWTQYSFPAALPPSTFEAPKPLPIATLPPI
jgi:hypothetical protein